jgi:uncharacterized protein with beta-barrel porin domain
MAADGNLGGDAYGIRVDATSRLDALTNSGHITVVSQGLGHSAYGIIDQSGTLTSFTNTGAIVPSINAANNLGHIVAVDLSANTTGVNFTNSGIIVGPVLLGSGNNTVNYTGGTQTGDLSFTGGTNALSFNNATLTGNITLGGGASTVSIVNSTLTSGITTTGTASLTIGQSHLTVPNLQSLNVTNATINSGSIINLSLNGSNPATGVINASGAVSIANGATINPVFTGIVRGTTTFNIVSSSALTLGAPLSSIIPASTSYMNAYTVQISPTNSNVIQLTAHRLTATEIGLSRNLGAVYEGAIDALELDQPVATALSSQTTRDTFISTLRKLSPDTSDAVRQSALVNQNLALGAVRRRLDGIHNQNSDDPETNDLPSFWSQGLGTAGSASANGDDQPSYSYWGLGVAVGADTPIGKGGKVGAAFSGNFTNIDFGLGPNSYLLAYSLQLNAYARENFGRFYIQGFGGGGYNNYDQRREIVVGSLRRVATGKSDGYQAGGSIEGGVRLEGGSLSIVPFIRAGYLTVQQGGYTEKNGGLGINFNQSSRTMNSFRSTIGLDVGKDFKLSYDSAVTTDFRASYSHDFKNDPTAFTAQFASAGTPFTLYSAPHGPSIYNVGFSVGHKDNFSAITVDYDAEVASHFLGHVATVTLRFRW